MARLDFFFDFASTYSHLAAQRIGGLAAIPIPEPSAGALAAGALTSLIAIARTRRRPRA